MLTVQQRRVQALDALQVGQGIVGCAGGCRCGCRAHRRRLRRVDSSGGGVDGQPAAARALHCIRHTMQRLGGVAAAYRGSPGRRRDGRGGA